MRRVRIFPASPSGQFVAGRRSTGDHRGARQQTCADGDRHAHYFITIVMFRRERPTLMRVTSFRAATSTTTTESVFSVAMQQLAVRGR